MRNDCMYIYIYMIKEDKKQSEKVSDANMTNQV